MGQGNRENFIGDRCPVVMASEGDELVIPIIGEELKADAVPVETGGVRVTKRVHSHDEVVEQQLRTGRVDVRRVPVNRPVEGPLPVREWATL